MARRRATLFRRLQGLPGMLKWTAGVLGGVAAAVTAYNQLSATFDPLIRKFLTPLPSDLVVYVSPDPLTAKSYLTILADNGFKTRYLDSNQFDDLPAQKPGVVIIGTKSRGKPLPVSPALKSYLTGGRVKLIGMGFLGAELFPTLESRSVLGQIANKFDSSVLLDSKAPPDTTAGLPMGQPLHLYDDSVAPTVNDVAVYDSGSLSLLGAHGIALHAQQEGCGGHYWPVVTQGNFALWGYGGADANRLTDAGKRLFVNLVKHAQRTPFEIAEVEHQHFKPGTYKGTLGCNFITSTYPLKANQAGDIRLRVTSREKLALILNGPGRVGYYARVDQVSPSLTYHVTMEDLAHGDEWFVSVTYFSRVTAETRIEYELEVSYPPLKSTKRLIWLLVGGLGLGLLSFTLLRLIKSLNLAATKRKQS